MSGPQNAVVGDIGLPIDLPQTQVPAEQLDDEKKLGRYSKTAEFKRLKEFMEARINFYQKFFPGGQPVKDVALSSEELAIQWKAAAIVVEEFERVLGEYGRAAEAVKDAAER